VKLGSGGRYRYVALSNDCLSGAQVFLWDGHFVHGRETAEDEPRSGRPAPVRTSTNIARVRAFIRQDRRLTILMIAEELNTAECAVHQIVAQHLNMGKPCAKMVPKYLNDDQKARRSKMSSEMFKRLETKPDSLIGS
jgi:hypothetical protein